MGDICTENVALHSYGLILIGPVLELLFKDLDFDWDEFERKTLPKIPDDVLNIIFGNVCVKWTTIALVSKFWWGKIKPIALKKKADFKMKCQPLIKQFKTVILNRNSSYSKIEKAFDTLVVKRVPRLWCFEELLESQRNQICKWYRKARHDGRWYVRDGLSQLLGMFNSGQLILRRVGEKYECKHIGCEIRLSTSGWCNQHIKTCGYKYCTKKIRRCEKHCWCHKSKCMDCDIRFGHTKQKKLCESCRYKCKACGDGCGLRYNGNHSPPYWCNKHYNECEDEECKEKCQGRWCSKHQKMCKECNKKLWMIEENEYCSDHQYTCKVCGTRHDGPYSPYRENNRIWCWRHTHVCFETGCSNRCSSRKFCDKHYTPGRNVKYMNFDDIRIFFPSIIR